MDYEIDIEIDANALDVEWVNQASLAMKYGRHWSKCVRSFTNAEENVKLVRSELIKQALEDPERYFDGNKKPTGVLIEAYYRNHKRHIEAKETWVNTQYELNIAEVAKKEISTTRKAALQNLVELHGQNYFAGPNVPRNLSKEIQQKETQKNADKGVAAKMKRKKK